MRRSACGLFVLFCVLTLSGSSAEAASITLGFTGVTNNKLADTATGEAQLFVTVTDEYAGLASNEIAFIFTNIGPNASSITDVYFDDGELLALARIIDDGVTVSFSQYAKPGNLPGGNTIGFVTSAGFSADSDAPVQPMGVNPGEQLVVIFTMQPQIPDDPFTSTLRSLTMTSEPTLRIGIHVQGFTGGGSESFVNVLPPEDDGPGTDDDGTPVPEPASIALFGLGALGMGLIARRRRSADGFTD